MLYISMKPNALFSYLPKTGTSLEPSEIVLAHKSRGSCCGLITISFFSKVFLTLDGCGAPSTGCCLASPEAIMLEQPAEDAPVQNTQRLLHLCSECWCDVQPNATHIVPACGASAKATRPGCSRLQADLAAIPLLGVDRHLAEVRF